MTRARRKRASLAVGPGRGKTAAASPPSASRRTRIPARASRLPRHDAQRRPAHEPAATAARLPHEGTSSPRPDGWDDAGRPVPDTARSTRAAWRASSAGSPLTRTRFHRAPAPATISSAEPGTPRQPASSANTASFARPRSGGAVTHRQPSRAGASRITPPTAARSPGHHLHRQPDPAPRRATGEVAAVTAAAPRRRGRAGSRGQGSRSRARCRSRPGWAAGCGSGAGAAR